MSAKNPNYDYDAIHLAPATQRAYLKRGSNVPAALDTLTFRENGGFSRMKLFARCIYLELRLVEALASQGRPSTGQLAASTYEAIAAPAAPAAPTTESKLEPATYEASQGLSMSALVSNISLAIEQNEFALTRMRGYLKRLKEHL